VEAAVDTAKIINLSLIEIFKILFIQLKRIFCYHAFHFFH
jgi:hypothetical protein